MRRREKNAPWLNGGAALWFARTRKDVKQRQVIESLATYGCYYSDERQVREWEAGEKRPTRDALIKLLVAILEVLEVDRLNTILEAFGYAHVSGPEVEQLGLDPLTAIAVPIKVRWKSGRDGGTPGMSIESPERGNSFVPWPEVKHEFDNRLLRYLSRHLPEDTYTAETGPGQNSPHWHIWIVNSSAKRVGHVWVGAGPERKMVWDGMLRVGNGEVADGTARTWQVFTRWSDGSYRREAMFPPDSD